MYRRELAKPRYHLLDTIRGGCIILVVFYHALYNLYNFYDLFAWFFLSGFIDTLRVICVGVFVIISGMCCRFSRSNWRRGLIAAGTALLITVFTLAFMPRQIILFGIIHMFSTCMLIYALLAPLINKIPTMYGIIIFTALSIISALSVKYVSGTPDNLLFFVLGFDTTVFSADYYPILPWVFVFLVGSFLGRLLERDNLPDIFIKNSLPWLSFIGRHTLIIYVVHQPILYGVIWMAEYLNK